MSLLKLFISVVLFSGFLTDYPKDRNLFISPVKIPLAFSANFGELRSDHFHSGMDIKTQGVTGKEIVAAASGYIYRISVSPGGFGKALYLTHPSGYSTVYGHLDRFIPEVEEYITEQQYEKKSFSITVFPPKDKFIFKQGDLIAWSGNTGSSSGPHLHYEIRKSASETPVNPLLFDFGGGDDILPVIEKLAVYPLSDNSLINGEKRMRQYNVTGGHGNYYIPSSNEITISGPAGFGIKSYDLLNESYNKCAVYSIRLEIDSVSLFNYVMDEFSFDETRFINSHIDYETYIREKTRYQRAFMLPNDKLSVYQDVVNRGIFDFNEDKLYHVSLILQDIHNNRSTLSFKVKGSAPELMTEGFIQTKKGHVMPYNKANRFDTDEVSVLIPAGALYDTLYFNYVKETGDNGMLSYVHQIHNIYTPVHKPYTLSIKPSSVPEGLESKLVIVQLGDGSNRSAVRSSFSNGMVTARPSAFGKYYIGIDTVPPVISANGLISGADFSNRKEIRIKISDDLSGISDYKPVIDGNWALFEYDQKNNVLIYRFDPERITKGTNHILTLKVSDNVGNESFFNCDFVW